MSGSVVNPRIVFNIELMLSRVVPSSLLYIFSYMSQ